MKSNGIDETLPTALSLWRGMVAKSSPWRWTVREETPELGEAIVQTLAVPDLEDILAGLDEVGLDSLLVNSPFKELPVFSTLVGLVRTIGTVRDYIFAKKVAGFLLACAEQPQQERDQFIAGLQDPQRRRRIGDTLLLLLDRLDSFEKAPLLGRLFAGMVTGRYDLAMFTRLAGALDRLSLPLFPVLRAFYAQEPPEPEELSGEMEELRELFPSGLVGMEFGGGWGGGRGRFVHNHIGRLFLEVVGEDSQP